jgi:hypothetical protein
MSSLPPGASAALQAANAYVAQNTDAHWVAVQSQVWLRRGIAPLLVSLVEDIAQISAHYENFVGSLANIEKLLETEVDASLSNCLNRLLYVNVITALETYLSDAFINTVVPNSKLMRRFIETTPEFQTEKIAMSDLFKAMEEIESNAKRYLGNVVWHHLERVKPMYRATLEVDFPADVGDIFRAILIRHDIVHRNGKTKDGVEINSTIGDIQTLIAVARAFVQQIDKQLARVKGGVE